MIMNVNFCQLAIIAIMSGSLIACDAGDPDSTCTKHAAAHLEHIDDVVRVKIDYSASNQLVASVSVPSELASSANRALLRDSATVLSVDARNDCQHDSVRVIEEESHTVYHYQIECGEGVDINRIDTELLDLIPATPELDVSITSPAATKNFVVHRDCSSPIYTYLSKSEEENELSTRRENQYG